MLIQKYCGRHMTGNKISARTIVREKKLKRLAQVRNDRGNQDTDIHITLYRCKCLDSMESNRSF